VHPSEVDYNVIRKAGENLVLVGAFPGVEILLDKHADVFRRRRLEMEG
jgi:hypothetical protein